MEAEGVVTSQGVLVNDVAEANRLHNRGRYGKPQSGGTLLLSNLEALYLLEVERLAVFDDKNNELTYKDIMTLGLATDERFDVIYLVYRALRSSGLVTLEASPLDLKVHDRGSFDPKAPAKYFVEAVAERDDFELVKVMDNVDRIEGIKREYVMGLVDEEGDLTYYQVASMAPEAKQTFEEIEGHMAVGFIGQDRVMVPLEHGGLALNKAGYFGKLMGNNLLLSLVEAYYLMEEGFLKIENDGEAVSGGQLFKLARQIQPDFDLRYAVYWDLKDKGLVVKTGFKYGAHFRVYLADPVNTHSDYLIHAVDWDHSSGWAEMSRGVRLAHGVRKDLVLAAVRGGRVLGYVAIKRKKI